jgi:hypothetical protein
MSLHRDEASPTCAHVDAGHQSTTPYEGGFDGVVSVEHEDPVWGGTPDRVETGLRVAHGTLCPLVVS